MTITKKEYQKCKFTSFEIGDRIVHNSGGPVFTVVDIRQPYKEWVFGWNYFPVCIWIERITPKGKIINYRIEGIHVEAIWEYSTLK